MSGLVHFYINGCTVVWYHLLVFTGGDLFIDQHHLSLWRQGCSLCSMFNTIALRLDKR